jgi:phosphatidylglycerol---prolipoprotein diacylglyceryl transferase
MHPVLFELPLPVLRLPLGAALGVVTLFGLLLAGFAWQRRSLDLALTGVVASAFGLFGAVAFRDRVLVSASLPVPAFGALLALALGVGAVSTLREAARSGLEREHAATACVAAGVGGVLGARLGFVLLHPRELDGFASVFAFQDGGLVGWAGLLFGIGAAWLALGRSAARLATWLDAAAPAFGFGVFATRVGCWLEGCDFGRPLTAEAPGVLRALGTFPAGSRAWVEQVIAQRVSASSASALAVHPAELYEAFGGVLLGVLAIVLRARTQTRGVSALACLLGYAAVRVVVDLFRDVSADVWAARVVALLLAAAAAALRLRFTPASRSA